MVAKWTRPLFSDADEEVLGWTTVFKLCCLREQHFDGGFDSELLDRLQLWNADSLPGPFRKEFGDEFLQMDDRKLP